MTNKLKKEKAWVWFKGGLKEGGSWVDGFFASSDEKDGLLIERPDFVSCRVPSWRVRFTEPEDKKVGPLIPEDSVWKHT